MSAIKSIIIFAIGAGAGSGVTYLLMKDKCEQQISEEVESVEAAFNNLLDRERKNYNAKNPRKEKSENASDELEEDKRTMSDYIYNQGYDSNVPLSYGKPPIDPIRSIKDPYVIPPTEFDSLPDFDIMELNYYADGVLANEEKEIIDNPDELVGKDFDKHIGDYENDAVHIRNEKLKTDIEVIYIMKNFYEIKEPPIV